MKKTFLVLVTPLLLTCCFFGGESTKVPSEKMLYIPLGDSYTIGKGVEEHERFPDQLVHALLEQGYDFTLVSNLAVSGATSQDVITGQLAMFEQAKPTFATLLIGANDIVRDVSAETFKANFSVILDRMITVLPSNNRLLILTIPDFTSSPIGLRLTIGRKHLPTEIDAFNAIINEAAKKRGLRVVDIEPITKKMLIDPRLTAEDGLHPSGKEYALWIKKMLPVVQKMVAPL
jgi:lysophospholipase L1-like esterase